MVSPSWPNTVFKNADRYGKLKPINNSPIMIFSGMATNKMFIWGTVRAIRPKAMV